MMSEMTVLLPGGLDRWNFLAHLLYNQNHNFISGSNYLDFCVLIRLFYNCISIAIK
jgi:hypothetical protein